jgi:hypothetical protein
MKRVSRRNVFQALAVTAGSRVAARAQVPEDRVKALQPVLAQRKVQVQALRDFAISDSVEPTQGIQRRGCA